MIVLRIHPTSFALIKNVIFKSLNGKCFNLNENSSREMQKFLEDNFQSHFAEKNDKNLRRVRLVDKNNYIIKLNYMPHASFT